MKRPPAPAAFDASANAPAAAFGLAAAFERYRPYVLSILRIMAGLLFLEHGLSKVFGFPPHGHMPVYPDVEWFAGRIEMVGGALIALGLFTRLAAFVVSGEMACAYFISHAPRSFFPLINGGEAAILFCFVSLSGLRRRRPAQSRCAELAEEAVTDCSPN
ncbi:MAG: DoxX family protein [Xanthobacteraceae bacterium]